MPGGAWEDYFIPGTKVLRNKFVAPGKPFGETDAKLLRLKEEGRVLSRMTELMKSPISGKFDYDHMKAIHRYLFQDVYEWAGKERTAPSTWMKKDGHAYYPAGAALTQAANAEYAKLAEKDFLRGMERPEFVRELAESWGEINVVHSFREGNTRSQFVFFDQLCEQAGYSLDVPAFAPGSPLRDEFVKARFHGQDTGSNARLAAVLDKGLSHHTKPVALDRGAQAGNGSIQEQIAARVAAKKQGMGTTRDMPGLGRPRERGPRR